MLQYFFIVWENGAYLHYTVETLYSTIYYSKYFIELNFDKSTQYVALWTHKRHPIPRPFGRAMECLLWVFHWNWPCYKGFLLYKENKKVVMGIMCHAFRYFFSEKRANRFYKGQQNFQHTQIHSMRKSLGIKQNGQPGNILLTELFAATTNEVIIILRQVIFISGRLNCNSIYLTPPGLVRGTVCVYPFEYET